MKAFALALFAGLGVASGLGIALLAALAFLGLGPFGRGQLSVEVVVKADPEPTIVAETPTLIVTAAPAAATAGAEPIQPALAESQGQGEQAVTRDTSMAGQVRYIAGTAGLGVQLRDTCEDASGSPGPREGARVVIEYAHPDCLGWFRVMVPEAQSSWVRATYLAESAPPTPLPTATAIPSPSSTVRPTLPPLEPPRPMITSTPEVGGRAQSAATATATPLPPTPTSAPTAPTNPPVPIDPALLPAWQTLTAIEARYSNGPQVGATLRGYSERTGARLTVGSLPGALNAAYRGADNTVIVNERLFGEDTRALAALLAHEIVHAEQVRRGEGGPRDCVRMEVQAYATEALVWSSLWPGGQSPGRTPLERHLDRLAWISANEGEPGFYRLVTADPGYHRQCELWLPHST